MLKESSAFFTEKDDNDAASHDGVALPSGFRVHSMSIIADPSTLSNRSLLLLAYISYGEGGISSMNYVVYQLQAIQSPNRKYELVLARNSACGRIPLQLGRSPDISATESVTGVFLAGGSFLFDLDKEAEHQGKKKYKY